MTISPMLALQTLNDRRSVPSRQLGEPGPSPEQLDTLLAAANRAPDHGKLVPWRYVLIRGDARRRMGQLLVEVAQRNDPNVSPAALDKDRDRFNFAPLVVTVVARIDEHHKVPAQEQLLSAGCVAYNLLLGAQSLGFGAQWLTGWAAYDPAVASALGLAANEKIIAFVHIGTAREPAPERLRPDAAGLVTEWRG